MASTIPAYMISSPELLDVVDEEWARDTLPDDGAWGGAGAPAARSGGGGTRRRQLRLPPRARLLLRRHSDALMRSACPLTRCARPPTLSPSLSRAPPPPQRCRCRRA